MTTKNTIIATVAIIISLFSANQLKAQATTTVNSTTGYSVTVTLTPQSIIAPSACPWGYNYNTRIDYDITISGTNAPKSLYTLQTYMNCNNQGNFSNLPKKGGSGFVTTHSNPYNTSTDCNTATVSSMNCNSFNLIIEGPGISYQNIYIPNVVALPVDFSHVEAKSKEESVEINWMTSFEINNDYFTVEVSQDGKEWKEVGKVEAAEGEGIHNYSATDNNPVNGMSFYRIKQTDINGSTQTSEIVVNTFEKAIEMSVYPNPAADFVNIESEEINSLNVVIMNSQGQVQTVSSSISGSVMSLNTSELAAGIYIIQVSGAGVSENRTLTIAH